MVVVITVGAFGGLLATGLARIRYHGYNSWPWIFFIEGVSFGFYTTLEKRILIFIRSSLLFSVSLPSGSCPTHLTTPNS